MKMTTCTAIAAAMVLTLSACNQQETANDGAALETASVDALNGTWKTDLASLKYEGVSNEFVLQDGTYKCNSCIPPLTVAADGKFHAVADRPYFDSMSVKTVDDRTVESHFRKGDKEVSSRTLQVSEKGDALIMKSVDATSPNAPPIETTTALRRAGPAPAGAHAISGQWTIESTPYYSDEALNVTYRVNGNNVTMNWQGRRYTAELGGPAVAMQGDTGGTTVAVSREGANGVRETFTRAGKQVRVNTIVPSPDGRSITYTMTDTRVGSKTTWTGSKTS